MTTTVRTWSNNWMEGIEDDANIAEISIPGTHESCARFQLKDAQCQWFSIINQLQRGIRFLDIRCNYEAGSESGLTAGIYLPIYHGLKSQHILFEEVQAQCVAFLTANPTEFILMNVQMNDAEFDPDGKFTKKFVELIEPYLDFWYLKSGYRIDHNGFSHPDLPAIEKVRRHIILVRSNDPSYGWGFPAPSQFGQGGFAWKGYRVNGDSEDVIFRTQNRWEDVSGSDKGAMVEQYIQKAKDNAKNGIITLNFASHTDNKTPGKNAQDMNERIAAYLQKYDSKTPVGVIPVDFTGNTGISSESLESQIIKHQSRQKPGYVYG